MYEYNVKSGVRSCLQIPHIMTWTTKDVFDWSLKTLKVREDFHISLSLSDSN